MSLSRYPECFASVDVQQTLPRLKIDSTEYMQQAATLLGSSYAKLQSRSAVSAIKVARSIYFSLNCASLPNRSMKRKVDGKVTSNSRVCKISASMSSTSREVHTWFTILRVV